MPGRRLTSADRQQIAAGLRQGLDYAEIARRLGRPTSTVSREVARNGGPGRYRAELAQLATTHRARRRPHLVAARPPGKHRDPSPDQAAAFEADFTSALTETGLPRTVAGVLACLYTAESGHTAAELAQRLQVSAATISAAVRFLERRGLIRRGRDHPGRRHRYLIDENSGSRAIEFSAWVHQRLAVTAMRGADMFGTDTGAAPRLAMAGRLFERVGDAAVRSAQQARGDNPTSNSHRFVQFDRDARLSHIRSTPG